jgi:MSHA biogenesis protein MshO
MSLVMGVQFERVAKSVSGGDARVVSRNRGFTMIELVVVIVLIGILSVIGAVVLKPVIDNYFMAQRLAELTDVADTALRRMSRDIRLALPNSLRVTPLSQPAGTTAYLELLATRTGGRYRSSLTSTGTGDILDFGAADTTFEAFGDLVSASVTADQRIASGDIIVVMNLFSDTTASLESNAYTSGNATYCGATFDARCNTSAVSGTPTYSAVTKTTSIAMASRQFPLSSPAARFQVVSGPVTYVCAPNTTLDANGNGQGTLTRISGYSIATTQPTPPSGTSSAVLANYVTACELRYTQATVTQNRGVASIRIALTRNNLTVSLYHEVQVNNTP